MKNQPKVLIVMGSDSDWGEMRASSEVLDELKIPHEVLVASAHRTPDRVAKAARNAEKRGIGVIIAGAGFAAALAGVVAAHTVLPVIGVPLPGSALNGIDALLATVQMPAGIAVATMSIGKSGARNAGILAAQILGMADPAVRKSVEEMREKMRAGVEEKDRALQKKLRSEGKGA